MSDESWEAILTIKLKAKDYDDAESNVYKLFKKNALKKVNICSIEKEKE